MATVQKPIEEVSLDPVVTEVTHHIFLATIFATLACGFTLAALPFLLPR